MVETLVALFVLAIGLLAVQAMQISSLRTNVGASLGTEAQLLADDMVNRILAYDDITTAADNADYDGIDSDGAVDDPGCAAIGCNAAQQVIFDTFMWKTELERRLPGGRGTVVSVGGNYTVTVFWDNDRTGAAGIGCDPDNDADLTCYIVQLNL